MFTPLRLLHSLTQEALHLRKKLGLLRAPLRGRSLLADASSFAGAEVATEEDVLHLRKLPDCGATLK